MSSAVATRQSWKTLPLPVERECFELPLFFSDDEAERLSAGHIPEDMDDKWFIFFEAGWLYFHLSWTGSCIFALRLDGSPAGVRVAECWACRDRKVYKSSGVADEREMIEDLIRSRLLQRW